MRNLQQNIKRKWKTMRNLNNLIVIPAKAGIPKIVDGIPAFAGICIVNLPLALFPLFLPSASQLFLVRADDAAHPWE